MEFSEWTIPFIEQARQGRFSLVLSDVTIQELQNAPEKVKDLPTTVAPQFIDLTTITEEQFLLASRYISEGALPAKSYADAQHIAIATVLKVDSLVSWNFKHMVNFFRLKQYNAINLKFGYQVIDIRTPKEVSYEDGE
jgi:hypothetical protein